MYKIMNKTNNIQSPFNVLNRLNKSPFNVLNLLNKSPFNVLNLLNKSPFNVLNKSPFNGGALCRLELQDHGEQSGIDVPEQEDKWFVSVFV